jgi:hypothetical protein
VKVRRLPVVDRVVRDGESVVLVGREVIRLSALATHLLDRCADWTDLDDLTAALLAEFGNTPPGVEPRAATEAAVTTLAEQGLVDLA